MLILLQNSVKTKVGQGHPSVMIYIIFVELETLMRYAKFQDYRPFGSGEEYF